jgi:hypothetical protein
MTEKQFPILGDPHVKSLPWRVIEPHRAQAKSNHSQTLEELAGRGGLGTVEIIAIMAGTDFYSLFTRKPIP